MQPITVSVLSKLEKLQNVPDEQLEWLIANSVDHVVKEGEFFITPDQPLNATHFIIEGEISAYFLQNGSIRELGVFGAGDITGYLPYSRGVVGTVYMKTITDMQVLSFPIEKIREMIRDHFELTQALVHVMSNRVREYTARQQQNEKMMALGKLSAGLAHELNNPASAIVRDSVSLLQHLQMQPESFKSVIAVRMDAEQIDAVNDELFGLLAIKDKPRLTLKEKSKLEDELIDWLDDHNVNNSYEAADNFADFGFTLFNLEAMAKHIPPAYMSPVFNWVSNLLITERMVKDIQESSRRIAELVSSVKTFTHMDRGNDKQYADIHTGIRNTLTMLGHKIRSGNIKVAENFDETLPPVKALIGELNQVWTNLIDNALDAMETNGKGTLTIMTEKDREFVQVCIADDGPGIPEDVRSRIFDPFFTTKEIGKGTGMGLEVVQRIVHQHNGSVKVRSTPGKTEFIVCFPING